MQHSGAIYEQLKDIVVLEIYLKSLGDSLQFRDSRNVWILVIQIKIVFTHSDVISINALLFSSLLRFLHLTSSFIIASLKF